MILINPIQRPQCHLQAILLRALQERKGYRVGEMDKERGYNIHRIICATNIDLEKAIEIQFDSYLNFSLFVGVQG